MQADERSRSTRFAFATPEPFSKPLRIIQVFNRYRGKVNGEETVVQGMVSALRQSGAEVKLLTADSSSLEAGLTAKVTAALTSAYNPAAHRRMTKMIEAFEPDVIHAHNLFPLLSPSILAASRAAGVATVMTAHSYALSCPVATHLKGNEICVQCSGGHSHKCLTNNCRGNWVESLAYAARNSLVDHLSLYRKNLSILHVLTNFAKRHFESEGFPTERVAVLPNAVWLPPTPVDPANGRYIAFAGRLEYAKGIDLVLEASRLTGLPVAIAGDPARLAALHAELPNSVRFVGVLDQDEMAEFYRAARFLVFPSRWLEMCPMTILEAMSHGLPVISSAIGGLGEMVEDGSNGMLVPVNDAPALARAMTELWHAPDVVRRFGRHSRRLAESRYEIGNHAAALAVMYRKAIAMGHRA